MKLYVLSCASCEISFSAPTDVLALAAAINELTAQTRRARTAMWCGLQMASKDMPAQCMRTAEEAHSSASPNTSLGSAALNLSLDSTGDANGVIKGQKKVAEMVTSVAGNIWKLQAPRVQHYGMYCVYIQVWIDVTVF